MDDAYSNKPTSARDRKSTIESMRTENMNYIDSSDVIVEYYRNQTASGLDRYFLEIEEWLAQDRPLHENTPLVLEADDGIGKKTLLVKWMEYHAKNKKGRYPDFIIPHFATQSGKNSNYFYAIYRILIKLRETLNVKQKVELLEEKLRRYFHYWLEICNRELEQQIVNGAPVIYDKIILIFEGIDNFKDMLDLHREANVSFWLPKYFPKNIKVIVTAEKNSNSMRILKSTCQVIPIVCDQKIIKQIVNHHFTRHVLLPEENSLYLRDLFIQLNQKVRNQPLFVKSYFSVFIPYATDGIVEQGEIDIDVLVSFLSDLTVAKLRPLRSVEELFEFQLNYFSEKFIFSQKTPQLKQDPKFIQVMTVLAITQKGLTYKEIQNVCGFDQKQWKLFLVFFKVFLMKHRELWIIHNEIFKKVVLTMYHSDESRDLHNQIAATLDRITNNSIRKLEEETFHLFMAKNFFRLKEVISIIENFLLLFNPNNKYDLCRYWQCLEENGFDPVLEYNKAVEGFQIHYHPTPEDLFRIIIQVSRFLKEFGDFETKNTPVFKHPPIIGSLQDLYDIGLIQELLKLNLYFNKDPELKAFDPEKHLKRVSKPIKEPVLTRFESLNVEIVQNREEVRNHYLSLITKKSEYTDNDDPDIATSLQIQQFNQYMHNALTKLLQQRMDTLSAEEEDNGERVSTDYYYKRWIWIQFPWACLSISKQCDYSKIIKHCFSSATDYMSVEEEHKYTDSALKIAIEAKRKKQQMYESNFDESSAPLALIPQRSVLTSKLPGPFDAGLPTEYDFDRSKIALPKLAPLETSKSIEPRERTMFITQDFTDFDRLNKEAKMLQMSSSVQILDGQNTNKLLEKERDKKIRIKQYQAASLSLGAYQQTEIFPILKQDISKHSQQQLIVMENQAKQMRRKLDTLVYENHRIAKLLKQQKIIEFNKGSIEKEKASLEIMKDEKKDLEERIVVAQKEYKNSTMQIKRVKTITKICKDNKQQNEESIRYLDYLTNNFKKLIKFEEQDNQKHKRQIQTLYKTIEEFLTTYAQKSKHQSELLNQIRSSLDAKKSLDTLFLNSDNVIQDTAMNQIQGLRRKQAQRDTAQQFKQNKIQQEKNAKAINERLALMEKQYLQIKDVFNIKEPNYTSSPAFVDFMASREKKSELEIILSELRQRQEEVLMRKEKLEDQLKTYSNAYQLQNQSSIQQDNQSSEHTDRNNETSLQLAQDQLKKLEMLKVRCLSSYDSLFTKLGCERDQKKLHEALKARKDLIVQKEGADAWQKLVTNKYDMDAVYKKLAPYQQQKEVVE